MSDKKTEIDEGPPLAWGRDVDWGEVKPEPAHNPPFWTVEVGKSRRSRRHRNQPNRQGTR